MTTAHSSFPQPEDPGISIWRYMDLDKFAWMLQREALYFARGDLLQQGDPYEGYITKTMAKERDQELVDLIRPNIVNPPDEADRAMGEMLSGVRQGEREAVRFFYASCWHMSPYESAAMWKLYAPRGLSICVRSTYQQLWDLLPGQCFLGEITYLNYDDERFARENWLTRFMHKRESFSHEKEVRAVLMTTGIDQEDPSVVQIDLHKLIHDLYIGPDCAPPLLEVVQRMVRDAEFDLEVKQSGVNSRPAW